MAPYRPIITGVAPHISIEAVIKSLVKYRDTHRSVEECSSVKRSDIRVKRYTYSESPSIFTGVEISMGYFIGRISFKFRGRPLECGGTHVVPYLIEEITDLWSDALFILLVENDSAFFNLGMSEFYNIFPSILVNSDGVPNVSTGLFLKKLHTDLRLPVLALTDCTPDAFKFLAFYGRGSENAYGSLEKNLSLRTPDIKWLGMSVTDLDKFALPEYLKLPMTQEDIKMAQDLLDEQLLKSNRAWSIELRLMLLERVKAELEAFSANGLGFLCFHYLPQKLLEQDWF